MVSGRSTSLSLSLPSSPPLQNLLSFGAEAEEEEAELAALPATKKGKNDDTRFLQAGSAQAAAILQEEEAQWEVKRSSLADKIKEKFKPPPTRGHTAAPVVRGRATTEPSQLSTYGVGRLMLPSLQAAAAAAAEREEGELSFAETMRMQMMEKRKARGDTEMVAGPRAAAAAVCSRSPAADEESIYEESPATAEQSQTHRRKPQAETKRSA